MKGGVTEQKDGCDLEDTQPLLSIQDDLTTKYTEDLKSERHPVKAVKEKKVILGFVVKRETTVWNLIAMSLNPAIVSSIVSFLNTMVPMLLQSEDYYGID